MAVALISGHFLSIIFLSHPIRLVKSYRLLPFPSPFSFPQTLKEMPQLFTAFMRACRCLSLVNVWLGGLLRFSFLSHSSASLTVLSVSLSVEFEQNTDNNIEYYIWCWIKPQTSSVIRYCIPVILSIKWSSSRTTFSWEIFRRGWCSHECLLCFASSLMSHIFLRTWSLQ